MFKRCVLGSAVTALLLAAACNGTAQQAVHIKMFIDSPSRYKLQGNSMQFCNGAGRDADIREGAFATVSDSHTGYTFARKALTSGNVDTAPSGSTKLCEFDVDFILDKTNNNSQSSYYIQVEVGSHVYQAAAAFKSSSDEIDISLDF